ARTPEASAACTCESGHPAAPASRRIRSTGSVSNLPDRSSCRSCTGCFLAAALSGEAHCTLPAVQPRDDTEHRKTVRTLIELAEGSSPADCWDDRRAEDLLRSQSTPEEVRELGMSEEMIARVFGGAKPHFTVRVSARFEAAHFLREYRGISEPLHGHSYKVEADLASRAGGVDSDAIAVDFVSARHKLEALAKMLDYGCINDVPPFDRIN